MERKPIKKRRRDKKESYWRQLCIIFRKKYAIRRLAGAVTALGTSDDVASFRNRNYQDGAVERVEPRYTRSKDQEFKNV
ncbi:MAG: hypothetical protein ACI4NP_04995 [Thermoguttaceae bacterium]